MKRLAIVRSNVRRGLAPAAAAVVLVAAPAFAQVPSYAAPAEETIRGTITSITGKYALVVADDRGFIDSVTLHDGTIVEPGDAALTIGALVAIRGKADGATFDADEIDADLDDDAYDTGTGSAAPLELGLGVVPPYVLPLGGGAYYYGGGCCLGSSSSSTSGSGFVYLTGVGNPPHPHARPPVGAPGLPRYLPIEPRRAPVSAPPQRTSAPASSQALHR